MTTVDWTQSLSEDLAKLPDMSTYDNSPLRMALDDLAAIATEKTSNISGVYASLSMCITWMLAETKPLEQRAADGRALKRAIRDAHGAACRQDDVANRYRLDGIMELVSALYAPIMGDWELVRIARLLGTEEMSLLHKLCRSRFGIRRREYVAVADELQWSPERLWRITDRLFHLRLMNGSYKFSATAIGRNVHQIWREG